ncbi:excinuclease ABC subunit UvrA [Herbiconiux sp. VKM Ac-1786]|uniref:excinuclease ABC subunit UvrA n=1 Tax=Herbiconiux sp. VKM Ac-1786 TaxID=2783824 RepID=UPI00188B3282|nr:excinuclease ABC subunit UvrA [Herbiconiux sp. VKM Ac-1786]MBF4571824.1 excinuclease ABC subunit UvrA [Herbiconiux sp. VKM Ac-1786]
MSDAYRIPEPPRARPEPPVAIEARGIRHNNLHDLDVDIPLHRVVAITGVSGSGKSSLAMGTLFAEGMQRFLEGLSTFSRRRLSQAQRPDADRISHLPAAVALRQRPPVPGPRSTVGTMSSVLNALRLSMSRLGSHRCPNGHIVPPSLQSFREEIVCPVCGVHFPTPSAESFAFNSEGACPGCDGVGERFEIDTDRLVPDPELTIEQGAVLPWNVGGMRLSRYAAAQLGVRLDVPWRDLSDREHDIVLHGEPVVREVRLGEAGPRPVTLQVHYENAIAAVRRAAKSDTASTRARQEQFLHWETCSVCHGTRLRPEALTSMLDGSNLAEISSLPLEGLRGFVEGLLAQTPEEITRPAETLTREILSLLDPLLQLGLGYLGLDRAGSTLSTGERQRLELSSTVRADTTGMLYVLDEPSVGLHPSNIGGLIATIDALVDAGNSVVMVEHDVEVIAEADWVIELGPGAGSAGGTAIGQGTPTEVAADPSSLIGPFLTPGPLIERMPRPLDAGDLTLEVSALHNLNDVRLEVPLHALTAIAGPSGAGKSALLLESLVPALTAQLAGQPLPAHVTSLEAPGIRGLAEIDATPIGANARSTPATYSGAFDAIRAVFAESPDARARGWKAGHFSYNTKQGQCPTCLGIGYLDLDVQYLPDVRETCPTCEGGRYALEMLEVTVEGHTIADVLRLTVHEALAVLEEWPGVDRRLRPIDDVGLGYLRLGEATPSLSGGEAQRLRIASRLRNSQRGVLYVFDEPSTGLHPLDIRTLVAVLDRLIDAGATVLVIDHDLDLLAAADRLIDLGPVGGPQGGRIVAQGSPHEVAIDPASVTGPYLAGRLAP